MKMETLKSNLAEINRLEGAAQKLKDQITETIAPALDIIWPEGWSDRLLPTSRTITEYDISGDGGHLWIVFNYSDGERADATLPLNIVTADDPAQAMREHQAHKDKQVADAKRRHLEAQIANLQKQLDNL